MVKLAVSLGANSLSRALSDDGIEGIEGIDWEPNARRPGLREVCRLSGYHYPLQGRQFSFVFVARASPFLGGWGDSLVGSNGKAALVKYELAQQVLSRLSPTGAGDVIWGNTLSKSLAEKMNKLREK